MRLDWPEASEREALQKPRVVLFFDLCLLETHRHEAKITGCHETKITRCRCLSLVALIRRQTVVTRPARRRLRGALEARPPRPGGAVWAPSTTHLGKGQTGSAPMGPLQIYVFLIAMLHTRNLLGWLRLGWLKVP